LFGFHEVHELIEEIVGPLCENPVWFTALNKLSLELITLLRSTIDGDSLGFEDDIQCDDYGVWPPLQKDVVIENLLRNRSGNLDDSSLETHGAVVCAAQLTNDVSTLSMCFPLLDNLFLRESFVQNQPLSLVANEYQTTFISDALRRKASRYHGETVSHADVDDIVTLGRTWGMDKSTVLTEFLLVMFELGKDDTVENLITSTRLIEKERFVEGAMPIACVRLDAAISTLKKAKQYRSVLAKLDADTCAWVKEQAGISEEERPDRIRAHDSKGNLISFLNTHELILRIKRMSSVNRIDASALSTMCETLLNAMEVPE